MSDEMTLPTTQRAYTLRLHGVNESDRSWREALWATHEAVNKGAKVFGDWLLTLRGGLDHKLADEPVKEKADRTRLPTDDERRDRRILLALSWLSVEDAHGAPQESIFRVATGGDTDPTRKEKVVAALKAILEKRKDTHDDIDIERWVADCADSLAAHIRKDAVWVNRSAIFDQVTAGWDENDARNDAHLLLSHVLSDDFLTLPTTKKTKKKEVDTKEDDEQEERRSAVKASSKGAGNRTRHAYCHVLGGGKPFGKPKRSLILRDKWRDYLKPKLDATGIPVLSVVNKGKNKKDSGPAHTELQYEMFSKAGSRVAQIVTKQRQQDADRLARKDADSDLQKMAADQSFNATLSALRIYCDEYKVISEATGEFMIRPRQVTGWDRVVRRWSTITETDPERAREARVEAVKEVQDSDEEKKFGDANLFFRLAEDRFTKVWCPDGNLRNADPTILDCFVKGMKARSDSERLKVAAYRHPDPYRNPIFCQFGVSRPAIHFRRLKAFTDDPAGNDPRTVGMLLWHPESKSAKLTLMHGVSVRLDREIGSACEQVQLNADELRAVSRRGRLGAAAGGLPNADSPARVAGVFDLKKIKRRSTGDEQDDTSDEENDTGKLKEPKWNGTLSADRRELEAIQKLRDKKDFQKANRRQQQLRWTLTVSMEMEGRGPWFRYVASAQDRTPFVRTVRKDKLKDKNNPKKGLAERKSDKRIEAEGWPWQEFNKPLKDNKDGTALVEDTTAARGEKACLILARLPGLRVLSVDLGHRFAASCAVWESLPLPAMKREIEGRDIVAGGTGDHDFYCHVATPTNKIVKSGRNKGERIIEITVYRRIGDNKLPDGSEHPAPWARLDRQFFIKLQGEEQPARAASNKAVHGINETAMVADLAKTLQLLREDADAGGKRNVDELMRRAVRIATLGLKRHGRRAKIAYAFMPNCPGIPGMGGKLKTITRGDEAHIRFLTEALMDWHALGVDMDWDGSTAREPWNKHIKSLPGGFEVGEPAPPDPKAERPTRQQRRKSEEELRERLKPIAEFLAAVDPAATQNIHETWANLWDKDDGMKRTKDDFEHTLIRDEKGKVIGSRTSPKKGKESPGGWHERLRTITDWIMGWHLPGAQSEGWNRNVGGLSLTRIATMKSLYQLHKAFAMRPRPHELRGAPEKGESNAGVAQSILDAMECMREQRVKQIASRIVEAALGVGSENPEHWEDGRKRPTGLLERHPKGGKRFEACHAVVIENLRNYRPDELQTRRENRALLTWSAGKVRKYLEEACQLHGLHLREVMPNYTSQQDSRTGLPGVRCADVPVADFLDKPWWRKAVKRAKERKEHPTKDKPYDAEAQLLVALDAAWPDRNAVLEAERSAYAERVKSAKPLRLITKGGDLFVAAPPPPCQSHGHKPCLLCDGKRALQADLNAAANIGLRALLDPDFAGKWWYVLCGEADAVPRADKVKGSACFGNEPEQFGALQSVTEPIPLTQDGAAGSKKAKNRGRRQKDGQNSNYWADPSGSPLRNAANHGFWLPTPAYWRWVRKRVIAVLRRHNGLTECPTEDIKPDDATSSPF